MNSRTLERLRWRQLPWTQEAVLEEALRINEEMPHDQPVMAPFAHVVSQKKWVGTLGMIHLDVGWRYVAVAPERLDLDFDPSNTGPRRWLNETLRSPDTAAAVLTCLARDLEPEPWVTAVDELANLSRLDLRRELASRHGWLCHICGEAIPPSLRRIPYSVAQPDPLFPDIEHVIPLAMGGAHWWPNLRLAHRRCNLQKAASDIGHGAAVEDFMRDLEARGID